MNLSNNPYKSNKLASSIGCTQLYNFFLILLENSNLNNLNIDEMPSFDTILFSLKTKQDEHIQVKVVDYITTGYSLEDQSNASIIFTLPIKMDQQTPLLRLRENTITINCTVYDETNYWNEKNKTALATGASKTGKTCTSKTGKLGGNATRFQN